MGAEGAAEQTGAVQAKGRAKAREAPRVKTVVGSSGRQPRL